MLNKGEKLALILSNSSTIYNQHLHYNLKETIIRYLRTNKSLKKLSNKIKDNLRFRLHPNSYLWLMKERITSDFGKNFIFKQKK